MTFYGTAVLNVRIPKGLYNAKVQGLCGNYDSTVGNDLVARNGTFLFQHSSVESIYYAFGKSWQVSEAESYFYYPATSTPYQSNSVTLKAYTQTNPANYVPKFQADFGGNKELEQRAKEACAAYGLSEQETQQCLFDVAVLGDVSAASAVGTASVTQCAAQNGTSACGTTLASCPNKVCVIPS